MWGWNCDCFIATKCRLPPEQKLFICGVAVPFEGRFEDFCILWEQIRLANETAYEIRVSKIHYVKIQYDYMYKRGEISCNMQILEKLNMHIP